MQHSHAPAFPLKPIRLLFLSLLPLCAQRGLAQSTDTASSAAPQQLDTITVTASGSTRNISDAPASIAVIGNEELEKRQIANLGDAVRRVEGVHILGGNKGAVSIRGMESGHVLTMVDGRRQNTGGVSLKGGLSEGLEMVWTPPVSAIDRIEVVRGPMSTLYGSDALGGVVNVITKKVGDEWTGELSAEGTLQQSGKSGDSYAGNLYVSGPIMENTLGLQAWGVYGGRSEDDIVDGFARSQRQGGNLRLWFTPNEAHEFMLEAGRIDQEFEATVGRSIAVPARGTAADKANDYSRENFGFAYTGRYGELTTQFDFNREEVSRNGSDETAFPSVKNTLMEAKVSMPFDRHFFLAGAQYQKHALSTDAYYYSKGSSSAQGAAVSNTDKALFAEGEWGLTENFTLTTGLRYDHNQYFGSHITPRIYGVWHISPDWTLKGGVSRGYKSPSVTQLNPNVGLPQRGGAVTWGNPDLKPEKSISSEIGIYYDGGGALSGNLTFFNTDYKNKIANTGTRQLHYPDGSPVPPNPATGRVYSTYFNITKAQINGLELAVNYQISPQWNLLTNYSYTHSKVDSKDATILGFGYPQADGLPLTATPKHQVNMMLDWQPRKDISAFAGLNYRSREQNISWGQGGRVSSSDGSITTFDLGLNWKPTDNFSLSAVAYNLTDKTRDAETLSADSYRYSEDGRRYWLKFAYTF